MPVSQTKLSTPKKAFTKQDFLDGKCTSDGLPLNVEVTNEEAAEMVATGEATIPEEAVISEEELDEPIDGAESEDDVDGGESEQEAVDKETT